MNEEELMRLDESEEQGETTVNDPERFTKYTSSELNKHSEDKQALLEAAQQDQEAAAVDTETEMIDAEPKVTEQEYDERDTNKDGYVDKWEKKDW